MKEIADLAIEVVGGLDVAEVTDSGQHHECRPWDLGVEVFSHGQRRAFVGVPVQQQGRDFDAGKNVSEIGLCKRAELHSMPDRMDIGHDRHDLVDHVLGRRLAEHPRHVPGQPFLGGQVGFPQGSLEAFFNDLGR